MTPPENFGFYTRCHDVERNSKNALMSSQSTPRTELPPSFETHDQRRIRWSGVPAGGEWAEGILERRDQAPPRRAGPGHEDDQPG